MNPQLKASLIAAGLYFVVANPYTYDLTQAVLGKFVTYTDMNGRPTQAGTLIHAGVYGLLTYLIMRLTIKRSYEQI
mgnify:CR=1 FL=1